MRQRTSSGSWRWVAVAALALAAVPLLLGRHVPRHRPMPTAPGVAWDVPGELVVQTRGGLSDQDVTALAAGFGLSASDAAPRGSTEPHLLRVSTAVPLVPGLLARLRADKRVEYAVPQRLFRAFWAPNDPRYKEQWNFARIHAEQAWDITRGRGAVVAVIDTGVAFEDSPTGHLCRDFQQTRFVAPYDFVNRDRHPNDDHGHGTHVAGTIAESTDNGEGVAGIAFEASVMPLKVLTRDGFGRMSDVAAAIRYAADHGANVINMSLGGPMPDPITRSACEYAHAKGVTIVCAAGNSGMEGVGYPAAYPECIAVSALGPTGELAPYSSWGEEVAVSAPGGDQSRGKTAGILQNTYLRPREGSAGDGAASAWELAGPTSAGSDQVDDYYYFQGTSMASPHVAAVAALIVSAGVRDPEEVRAILRRSAQPRGDSARYGAGEVDAAAATRMASGASTGYYSRLGILVVLALLAFGMGAVSKAHGGRSPWPAFLAIALGMVLPDLIEMLAGFGSFWNIVGHSVLVPGYLLTHEADSRAERRFYGLMATGTAAHLALDLWHGTAPFIGFALWAATPWLVVNSVIGLGVLISSLRREK